jgi:nucleoside-diphosphate-sugar epimerase
MALTITKRTESLARRVCRRERSLFEGDLTASSDRLDLRGRSLLVVGGAGTIGAATLLEALRFEPSRVVVMDTSENNLAELARTIRSGARPFQGELDFSPLDYGSDLAASYLASLPRIDVVMSFAALKHVRSERDIYSCLALLDVNVLRADRFLTTIRRLGHGSEGVFFVSTDKAAHPASVMGATKRLMESVLWSHAAGGAELREPDLPPLPRTSTVRFANVAFSDGSLPWAFLQRVEKGQPLGAPKSIRRYFVTSEEAGQLCLLAARVCPHRHVLVPRLDPELHTSTFPEIARITLDSLGYEPSFYEREDEARRAMASDLQNGRYPVVLTRADTSGEKEMEVFVGRGETAVSVGMDTVDALEGIAVPEAALTAFLRWGTAALASKTNLPSKQELVERLAAIVPGLVHGETGSSLDGRI